MTHESETRLCLYSEAVKERDVNNGACAEINTDSTVDGEAEARPPFLFCDSVN